MLKAELLSIIRMNKEKFIKLVVGVYCYLFFFKAAGPRGFCTHPSLSLSLINNAMSAADWLKCIGHVIKEEDKL